MDQTGNKEDDFFSIICGDLGLGESSRGAQFLKFDRNCQDEPNSCRNHNDSILSELGVTNELEIKYSYRLLPSAAEAKRNSVEIRDSDGSLESEYFPMYADVPYGTSLKQQKKLYEKQINNLRKHFTLNQADGAKKTRKNIAESKKEHENRLLVALQEMDELKIELDACRKRLDAKYKAVAILRQQVENADTELKNTEKKASETSRKLEQEVSKLQFELEWRESSFLDSQQTWAERFDRVCQENSSLSSKLEARNEELRRANAHKSALARERDELLALLDVTERQKYEHGRSRTAEEDYETFSSSELAVLGACKCRVTNPDPCGCAHAAANLRKEVSKLKDELSCNTQRREEANLTVDAYRSAFEEQLAKSRSMSLKLSQLATISSRSAKARAAIKWLIQVLNDDDYSPPKPIETAVDGDKGQTITTMSLQELVTLLTEMVIEKNEVLAHNKLASQVLANKLLKYEQRDTETPKDSQFKIKDGKLKSSKLAPNYKLHMYIKQPNAYSSSDLSEDVEEVKDEAEKEDASALEECNDQYECDESIAIEEDCCSLTDSNNRPLNYGDDSTLAMNERIDEMKSDLVMAEIHQNKKSSELKVQDVQDDYNNNDSERDKCIQADGHLQITETCENVNTSDETIESVRSTNQNVCNLEQKHPEKPMQNETVNLIISEEELELDIEEK